MNDPKVFESPCAMCKKREATQLCDYIVRYDNSVVFLRNRIDFNKANSPGRKHETCDLPICKDCSHDIGMNVDVCPHHYKLHLQTDLPLELQKYQKRIFT